MNKREFMLAQFEALRTEIKTSKQNAFHVVGAGLAGIPSAHFLIDAFQTSELVLGMPLLVVVAGFLYMSEMHAVMRCGRYIREHIEPCFPEVEGWEAYLAAPEPDRRTVDKLLFNSFYLLFLIYFAGSSIVAVIYVFETFSPPIAYLLLAFYVTVGAGFAYFLIANIRETTGTTSSA